MFNVTITVDHIRCHAQVDNWERSEPYLWTVFFYADIDTAQEPGNRLVTYTPYANATTRGMYAGGVEVGDVIQIPESIGRYSVVLDDGGLDTAVAGVLFVLLEQDLTPGDAIRAGHQALAGSAHAILNDYVEDNFPLVPPPTAEQIQAMADQIEANVKNAVRDRVKWWQVLHDQDDFFGFGYRYLTYEELEGIASGSTAEWFTARIVHEETSHIGGFGFGGSQPATFLNDYEIFGLIEVRRAEPTEDVRLNELAVYQSAVANLKSIGKQIQELRGELKTGVKGERRELLRMKLELARRTLPLAVEAVGDARQAYTVDRQDGVAPQPRKQSVPDPGRVRFRKKANVVAARTDVSRAVDASRLRGRTLV
jgi:hypothetical protein